jgi:ubiquitin carboxyl-terminal hydrolase 5/13
MELIDLNKVVVPDSFTRVFKDDCMFSFDTPFDPQGLDICMTCHQAFSRGEFKYTQMHSEFYDHDVFLNYKKVKKVLKKEQNPPKMIKLEIKETSEADLFETICSIYLPKSDISIPYPDNELQLKVIQAAEGIINATSSEKKEEIMAWEQEIKTCKHSNTIIQNTISNLQLKQCNSCDLKENLWICLHCGNLGCGRSQFGGVAGNSHAMEHQKQFPDHAVAVKLGSLSTDIADCYCYSCDDEVKVPNLSILLKTFDIDITKFVRTEKSLTELQIEQNIQWDFKMVGDGNQACKPVFGSGLTGLKNLGNSCYLASVLQVLFSIDSFKKAYFNPDGIPLDKLLGNLKPYEDLETQLFKLGDGLISGRYSIPDDMTTETIKYQRGIRPSGFKNLIGEGHPEFCTMLQQDAYEFWVYLIEKLEKEKAFGQLENSPTSIFKFIIENKIKCSKCNGVRIKKEITDSLSVPLAVNLLETDSEGNKIYAPTTIEDSLSKWNGFNELDYSCPKCGSTQSANKKEGFQSVPEILVINPQRVILDNWVPTKVPVPIKFEETLDLKPFLSEGILIDEEELPDEDSDDNDKKGNSDEYEFNQAALNGLLEMGFSENKAKHALYATGNSDMESAMNWLFQHMEDLELEKPFVLPSNATNSINPVDSINKDQLENLINMGFSEKLSVKSLFINNNNIETAVEWLFNNPDDDGEIAIRDIENNNGNDEDLIKKLEADNKNKENLKYELLAVICHKGTSVHSGHYVAFIKKVIDGVSNWVLFNDEKVVLAVDENFKEIETSGYLYIYQRVD